MAIDYNAGLTCTISTGCQITGFPVSQKPRALHRGSFAKVSSKDYWKNEGCRKTFTHMLNNEWIKDIDRRTAVLDFGCGYGRLTPDLINLGFNRLYAYDPSEPLVERARKENPGALYSHDLKTLHQQSFGLVLCFAVFTSCPGDADQLAIVESIESVTETGAVLYISDYVMQDNPGYQERYEQREAGVLGRFTSGAGSFRHHDEAHFHNLLPAWQLDKDRSSPGKTMNGSDIVIHQYRFIRIP